MDKTIGAQNRLQQNTDLIEAMRIAEVAEVAAASVPETSRDGQRLFPEASMTNPTKLSASAYNSICGVGCRCSCHTKTSFRSQSTNHILGSVSIGYTGLPYVTPQCNYQGCRQRAYLNILITYAFPSWFLARAFTIALRLFPFAGPQLNLRFNPLVPSSSAIFAFATTGDIQGIQRVLSSSEGSPFDAESSTGATALLVCYCDHIQRMKANTKHSSQ